MTTAARNTFEAGALTVFPSQAARAAARRWLAAYGANYFTEYRDTRGFGLSWAVTRPVR